MTKKTSETRIINPFKLQSIRTLWPNAELSVSSTNQRLAKKIRSANTSYEIQSNALVNGNSLNGVHDINGDPLKITFLRRGMPSGMIREAPEYPIKPPEKIYKHSFSISKKLERAYWISSLELDHFGHTLTETASSLFPLLAWNKVGFNLSQIDIIITENFLNRKSIELLHSAFPKLSLNRIHVARQDETILIEKLFIPHPTMIIRESVSEGQILATKAMVEILLRDELTTQTIQKRQKQNVPANANAGNATSTNTFKTPSPGKLWLSRRNVSNRHFLEEQELERVLSDCGWHILCPEDQKLDTQLSALSEAKVIAGTMSSSFHLLMALSQKKTTKSIYMLAANQVQTATYFEQFKRQGFRFTIDNCLEYSTTSNKQLKLREDITVQKIAYSINTFAHPALKKKKSHRSNRLTRPSR